MEIEKKVGQRVRARRLLLNMSLEELAAKIGLTYQQVQKYEKGTNRISVSRLVDISKALKAPLEYFYHGLGQGFPSHRSVGFSDTPQSLLTDGSLEKKEIYQLVSYYLKIKNAELRKQLLKMAQAMASK